MSLPLSLPSVYPRVCGGTRVKLVPAAAFSGRVCGGTFVAVAVEMPATVYLHVCGGTHTWNSQNSAAGGLSPRVRGNLDDGGRD